MKKWIFLFVAVLALGFALLSVLNSRGVAQEPLKTPGTSPTPGVEPSSKAPEPAKPVEESKKTKSLPVVATETVKPVNLSKTLDLTGSVVASRVARMASPGEGPIQDSKLLEGDTVKRGERIVTIGRHKAAAAQLMASEAMLREQEEELKRTEQLVKSGAIPGALLDSARSKQQSARAQLMKAKESTEDFAVSAPWDGIVSKVMVKDGDYVAPRTPLVEIFDPKSFVIRFAVPEAQATEVRTKMEVSVQLDAHPGKTFRGKVSRVYPELDSRMRTRTVEATLSDPVDLIPGMFTRIQVNLKTIQDAVVVPSETVIVTPKGERIVFALKESKALRRKVVTGIEEGGKIQIVEGVLAGEEVIVSGNEKLKDGAEVQVRGGGGK